MEQPSSRLEPATAPEESEPWEYSLRKYLLILATVVATVTYTVGFDPPGGVWPDTNDAVGYLAGDPIIRATNYRRYLVFFYCNCIAFASSIVVIVLFLLLAVLREQKKVWIRIKPLRVFMVLDLLSLVGAYVAGHWRNYLGTILGPGPVFQIGKISVRTYIAHETTNPTKAAHLFGRVTLYLPIGVC
jgi:hypothetical protein